MEGVEHLCSGNLLFKFRQHWYASPAGFLQFDMSLTAMLGPLCTADACATADQERERILTSYRNKEAMAQKMKEKEQNSPEKQKENLENAKKKEAEWKQKEAAEDAARARIAQGLQQI